jgi:hypothetical protein
VCHIRVASAYVVLINQIMAEDENARLALSFMKRALGKFSRFLETRELSLLPSLPV